MTIRDKLGWPVEKFVGRPLTNFARVVLHGNIKQTYHKLNKEKYTMPQKIMLGLIALIFVGIPIVFLGVGSIQFILK
jgi:hypothetical protein